jgi:hypothetical protein
MPAFNRTLFFISPLRWISAIFALLALGVFSFGTPDSGCGSALKFRSELWLSGLDVAQHQGVEELLATQLPASIAWDVHRADNNDLAQTILERAHSHARSSGLDERLKDRTLAQKEGDSFKSWHAALDADIQGIEEDIALDLNALARAELLSAHVSLIHFNLDKTALPLRAWASFLAEVSPPGHQAWLAFGADDQRPQLLANAVLSSLATLYKIPEDHPPRFDDPARSGFGIDLSDPEMPLLNPVSFSERQVEFMLSALSKIETDSHNIINPAQPSAPKNLAAKEGLARKTPTNPELRPIGEDGLDTLTTDVLNTFDN